VAGSLGVADGAGQPGRRGLHVRGRSPRAGRRGRVWPPADS